MSRAAQEVARIVREMKSKRRSPVSSNGNGSDDATPPASGEVNAGNELADVTNANDSTSGETQGEAAVAKTTKAKKAKAPKKAKAAKTPKVPKAPKAPKTPKEATRTRVAAEGEITGVSAKGETYLEITFTTGQMTLTPTSNRVHNRDLIVKQLNALLKK